LNGIDANEVLKVSRWKPMDFFAFHEKVTKRSAKAEAAEATPSGKQRDILTITQLTALIDRALKDCLPSTLTVMARSATTSTMPDQATCISRSRMRGRAWIV
jgi:hypothetical protein